MEDVQAQVIGWLDGRVFPIIEGPSTELHSVAALFLFGERFRGPIRRQEIPHWLELVAGDVESIGSESRVLG